VITCLECGGTTSPHIVIVGSVLWKYSKRTKFAFSYSLTSTLIGIGPNIIEKVPNLNFLTETDRILSPNFRVPRIGSLVNFGWGPLLVPSAHRLIKKGKVLIEGRRWLCR
jgi:hypothetical protein